MGSSCSQEARVEQIDQRNVGGVGKARVYAEYGSNGTTGTTGTDESRENEARPIRRLSLELGSSLAVGSFRVRRLLRNSNYNEVHHHAAMNLENNGRNRGGTEHSPPLGVCGLSNMGNTCFLNSSLQCLSATIPLTDYFLGYNYRLEINKDNVLGTKGKLAMAYADLMSSIWSGNDTVVRPKAFKSQLERFAPQFQGTNQHDAQELLAIMLDGIHEDLNRIKTKPYIEDRDCDGTNDERDAMEAWKNYLTRNKSIVVDIFQGQMRSCLSCLHCGHRNIRFEPFMYLSLPITSSCKSVKDCLELYLAPEKLTGDNQWYCGKCKCHRDAIKKTDIWILPPILIVHLKRFRFDEYGNYGSKNTAPIDYPIENWCLQNYVKSRGSDTPSYNLYAVSCHCGGLGSGHYTAYAVSRFGDEEWYEFNDSQTRRIPVSTLRQYNQQSSAYLLFYNRVQPENPQSPSSERTVPLIRRQSLGRPDLWPHTQVLDYQFREFSRTSMRVLEVAVVESIKHEVGNEDGHFETSLETTRQVSWD